MHKKNEVPPVVPRKLVLLVAAALAAGPVHAVLERPRGAPITFERNMGQFAPDVLFVTRAPDGEIAVRSGDVSIAPSRRPAMRLRLSGSNPTPEIEEQEPAITRSNYYGGRAGRALTGVPHFGRLLLKDVYPSVDLALHGAGDELEYDFVVAPGADPSGIRIDLSQADHAWIDDEGNLRMRIAGAELVQRAPVAYQPQGTQREPVPARFELHRDADRFEARFVTAEYDRTRTLVIDPVLNFSTYLGSSGGDYGGFMKIDSTNRVHSAKVNREELANILAVTKHHAITGGVSWSTTVHGGYGLRVAGLALSPDGDTTYAVGSTPDDFNTLFDCAPCTTGTTLGNGEAYVLAFDNNGVLTAGRYIGGSGMDEATGVATDPSGNVYVLGNTNSPNFPATVGSYVGGQDVFVAKLPANLASETMSVLLGGSGDDQSVGIAVDAAGNIYAGMRSPLPDFPPDQSFFGGSFLAKLDAGGSFQHSTYLGASGYFIKAVELDASSQPVVAGSLERLGLSTDAFVKRISPDGGVLSSYILGGSGHDEARALMISGDSIYVAGETFSDNFPVVAAPLMGASGGSDAFVARFGPSGLEFATRFGGIGDEFTAAVAVAPSGDIYLMGTTQSADFPMVAPTRDFLNGGSDLFFARLSNEFNLSQGTLAIPSDTPERVVHIARTGSLTGSTTVKWAAVNGTALAGTHYGTAGSTVLPSGVITFAPGVGSVALRIGASVSGPNTIRVIGAAAFAPPRTFSIALSLPTGGPLVGSVGTMPVTISQGASGLMFEQSAVPVLENAGSAIVRVQRAPGSTLGPASVAYTTANGTALAGTHYTTRSGTLTWSDGDDSVKEVAIPILDNAVPNASRAFTFRLSNATGLPIAGSATATITILDQDNTIALAGATQAVTEGAASVTLQVRRTGSATLPASVQWATENATAVAGTDFGAAGNPASLGDTLNWAAGDLSVRNIVIPLLDDPGPEPVKTFKVNLAGVSGATLGITSTTVTLNDNERGFAFLSETYSVTEGQPSIVLTVRRMGTATAAASLTWSTANGSATAGQDFGTAGSPAQRSGTINWVAGDASNKTITIPIIDDAIGGEPAETFTVTLSTSTAGHLIGIPGVATVTINENDLTPESAVQFGDAKYVTTEDAGTVSLLVWRTDIGGGFGREARVNYATQPGTALATSDFVSATGTIIWPAGDSSPRQINIGLANNATAEPPESFKVVLSSPAPGTALGANTQATVVILDDDEQFPRRGAMPDAFTVPPDATRGWHVSGDAGAYEGVFALKSDEIGDGETAAIEMDGTFAAGNVSFRVRISSEPGFDALRFYIDGVLKATWSGTATPGWQMSSSYPLAAGPHVLRFEYAKDASASTGMDAAYIDALVAPAFTP